LTPTIQFITPSYKTVAVMRANKVSRTSDELRGPDVYPNTRGRSKCHNWRWPTADCVPHIQNNSVKQRTRQADIFYKRILLNHKIH